MIRIFVEESISIGSIITILENKHHYLKDVMRIRARDELLVFNSKDGEFLAIAQEVLKKNTILKIKEKIREYEENENIKMIFSPIRPTRLNFLIEKATEMGVTEFVPLIAKNSQFRNVNINKLRLVSIEAAEQCKRLDIPIFKEQVTLETLLTNWNKDQKIIFCNEKEKENYIKIFLDQPIEANSFIIGPEGGFSIDETKLLQSYDFVFSCHLGRRILRAETAAIMALSCLNLRYYS